MGDAGRPEPTTCDVDALGWRHGRAVRSLEYQGLYHGRIRRKTRNWVRFQLRCPQVSLHLTPRGLQGGGGLVSEVRHRHCPPCVTEQSVLCELKFIALIVIFYFIPSKTREQCT
eukprot:630970-Rhodomonas_salina.1